MQLLAFCQAFDAVVCLNYFIRCLKRGDAVLVAEAPAEETSKSVAKGGFGPGSIMKKVLLHAAACKPLLQALVENGHCLISQVKASEFQSSTKIEAVVDEINKMIQGDNGAKEPCRVQRVPDT